MSVIPEVCGPVHCNRDDLLSENHDKRHAEISEKKKIFTEVVEEILWTYKQYGFRPDGFSIKQSVDIHIKLSIGVTWFKYWKYCLASFFSYWKKQERPKCIIPKQNYLELNFTDTDQFNSRLLYGRGDRYIRLCLSDRHHFDIPDGGSLLMKNSFLQSILMLKKGLPRPDSLLLKKGALETFEMLTNFNPLTPAGEDMKLFSRKVTKEWEHEYVAFGLGHTDLTYDEVIGGEIKSIVKQICLKANEEDLSDAISGSRPLIPSTSANYVTSRSAAGTFGLLQYLLEHLSQAERIDAKPGSLLEMMNELRYKFSSSLPYRLFLKKLILQFSNRWGHTAEMLMRNVRDKGKCTHCKIRMGDEEDYIIDVNSDIDIWVKPSELYMPIAMQEDAERLFEDLSLFVTNEALAERPDVTLVALPEALKVRVISKGPPLTYYRLKPFQKVIHKAMRHIPVFEFIGKPQDENDMDKIFGRLKEGEKFISGDYKDATNNMHPHWSKMVINCFADELQVSHQIRELMHRSMTGHNIADPVLQNLESIKTKLEMSILEGDMKWKKKWDSMLDTLYEWIIILKLDLNEISQSGFTDLNENRITDIREFLLVVGDVIEYLYANGHSETKVQKNGQLMGSIMSFPVLCVVNAAVLATVHRMKKGRKLDLYKDQLRVNGDDFVYVSDVHGYDLWKVVAAATGMEESVGKTFFSDQFLNINSREYQVHVRDVSIIRSKSYFNLDLTEVPFINLGLLKNLARSGNNDDNEEKNIHMSIKSMEMLKLCPKALRNGVYDRFLNYNMEELKKVKLPWFIPTEYGGWGLPLLMADGQLFDYRERGGLPLRFPGPETQFVSSFEDRRNKIKKLMPNFDEIRLQIDPDDLGSFTVAINLVNDTDLIVPHSNYVERFPVNDTLVTADKVFHKFGKIVTYPTAKNLAQLRALLITKGIDEIQNVAAPRVYKLHDVISKNLPETKQVVRSVANSFLDQADQATPYINFLTYLMNTVQVSKDMDKDVLDNIENRQKDVIAVHIDKAISINEKAWKMVGGFAAANGIIPFDNFTSIRALRFFTKLPGYKL